MSGGAFVWGVGIQKAKVVVVVVVVNEREGKRVEAVRLIGCLATVGGGREGGRSDELPLTTDDPHRKQHPFSCTSMTTKFDPSKAQNAIEVFCFSLYPAVYFPRSDRHHSPSSPDREAVSVGDSPPFGSSHQP